MNTLVNKYGHDRAMCAHAMRGHRKETQRVRFGGLTRRGGEVGTQEVIQQIAIPI